MKVRSGFVSNSSSSSFIIDTNSVKNISCPTCKKMFEKLFETKNAREYIEDDLGYNTYQDFLDEFDDNDNRFFINAVKNNEDILISEVDYENEYYYKFICDNLGLKYERC